MLVDVEDLHPIEKADLKFIATSNRKTCRNNLYENENKIGGISFMGLNKWKVEISAPNKKDFSFTLSVKAPDDKSLFLSVPLSVLSCSLVPLDKEPIDTSVTRISSTVYKIQPSTHGLLAVKLKVYDVQLKGASILVPLNPHLCKNTPIRTIAGLNGPWGVAIASNGHIFVSEFHGECVTMLDSTGKKVHSYRVTEKGNCKYSHPRGIAIITELSLRSNLFRGRVRWDQYPVSNDYLIISDEHRIRKVMVTDGLSVASAGKKGSGPPQFNFPIGLAVCRTLPQSVYVCDCFNHCIQILDSALQSLSMFGSEGSGEGQFDQPTDIAIDNQGCLYVTDTGNHRIQKFSSDGKFIFKFGTEGSGQGQLKNPYGITIDEKTDLLYVTERSNSRISVFNSDGEFVCSFGSKGNGDGELNEPRGVSFNRDGFLYVCDYLNNRIVVY
ncbi:PREDICTED: E3 ubiquitin-protein ligase TRIM71-like [Amphimedon queenslandica]|uniref:SMP-30/Gluconolactonase/LRE-like region domain-containing protein n=1 Tax=Amphimedon queenslandica TaxID=400682 RepID=A0A1X7SR70_AMPQE|nr:PREDICTED: E3 ubiquitin-protein ligase TRIM71-like [Amphimedon queenslandica]|eukprot:XP_011408980.1 PREDICTED: E3 ubiquitin-protein ligase TRIM71-like [Amphimedon queenslandica]